ncbi:F0F1 ATP synthase subunit delta [Jannaschia seohaensis]|uniref:ATP synthase subunit b n=1 Tax=Jannaschia seohaensis TaxID=475081 RepID=A0A2Y9BZF5_9RHOB|nr:F0F1 ATP synthase subunit delta [Jannaschia seohaensis]PWJ20254.1 F-type H+-transporting ATPase subunit b [Jannaschia seohaensis]SSA44262.1 F-type H+-transporting ATPase subunit b [Jannaschia seohaensis]
MEIDWWTLAIQTVNFLVVVWLLSRFLDRPVQRMIAAREAADRAAAEDAEGKADEAERLRADYERKLAAFDEQMDSRETELHEGMQREREQTLSDASQEAERLRAAAQAEIEETRSRALTALRDEIVALARDLAETALSDAPADPLACLQAELARQEEADLARMRRDLSSGGGLTLVTVMALSEDMRERMCAALGAALGDVPALSFELDPGILGGLRLRLPHGELDASVAGRLEAAARAMAGGDDDA